MRSRSNFALLIAGLAATAGLLVPGGAAGSSASISGGELRFYAAAGETNDVDLALDGPNFVFTDPGSTITPGPDCATVTLNRVTCTASLVTDDLAMKLGDMNDRGIIGSSVRPLPSEGGIEGEEGDDTIINLSRFGTTQSGGDGDDILTGGPVGERLSGGIGDDTLTGNAGGDQLDPGRGDDTVSGGDGNDYLAVDSLIDGADTLSGGVGFDEISYGGRDNPLKFTPDGLPNDGETGEGDNVGADIEAINGGSAADTITGGSINNSLSGGPGADVIIGGGGADVVDGDGGNDVVKGGPGNDLVIGDEGSDMISGDEGDDAFRFEFSDLMPDQISGGPGLDTFRDAGVLGVKIDLDGVADDGYLSPLEGPANDNVGADVENIDSSDSNADDVLAGNGSPNSLNGGGGDDRISGQGGADALAGGPGDDRIAGGTGIDDLQGNGGSDVVRSRDAGPDEVSCGSADDRMLGDQADEISVTCELKSTGALLKSGSARLKKGNAALKVSCPIAEGIACRVKITASQGKKAIAKGVGKVRSGKTGGVRVRLTKAGRKARTRRLIVKVRTVMTDASGAKATTTRAVTLKR